MQSIQVAELKAHFSDVLKTIKQDGTKFVIEYGKQHEKVALLIPYDKNLVTESERVFGPHKGRGGFTLKEGFTMSDEELLGA